MSNVWTLNIGNQYYANFCPCFLGMDMCAHVGGRGCLGCLFSCACPLCYQCYVAPKIAAKSGIDESMGNAVLKTCCCMGCYGGSVVGEYFKQKKLNVPAGEPSREGVSPDKKWMIGIQDQWYAGCCPCCLAKDMYEHVGESGAVGCCLRWCLGPVFLCCVAPKIAKEGEIPESCAGAIFKTCCPCTGPCYATSVYVEYKFQQSTGLGKKPAQMEMQ